MAKEIERKYLVVNQNYRQQAVARTDMVQAYLSAAKEAVVRVRIGGSRAWITVKGPNSGAVRDEWEYEIPVADAREMIDRLAGTRVIDKTRYVVPCGGLTWEVDEFHGRHSGLVVAEVELPDECTQPDPLPDFVGSEVTGDARYYNSVLVGS